LAETVEELEFSRSLVSEKRLLCGARAEVKADIPLTFDELLERAQFITRSQ
jgi:hypothetical protein